MMQGSLAEKLRVLRARMGLSLTEAASRAGVTRDTLSDLEHGKRQPYMPTLAKIAAGYGVPVEELLEEPALAGKAEAPQETGHESGPPQVSHEELAELGVTATDPELRQLNDTMASFWRLVVLEEKAHAFIGQDEVDTSRILMLMHLVLGTPDIVSPEAAGVVNQGMRERLKTG
jgi:transcriptional regulator with XRE-family HTH domain